MADVEIEDRGTALLPGAHRVVRALDPSEGPFAGTLVTSADGVSVRVDAAALAGWVGWRFAGAEHVAGPVDVIRRADGHDALLPWCADRVLGFLVRRTAADSALSSGECTTLVASLLRGLDELGDGVDAVQTGVWWLTDGGRPTFVIGEGEDPRAGAAEIVQRLRDECGDKALGRVLTTIEEGLIKALAQPRVPRRSLDDWERELLAIAAPRPLAREVHAPERAREVARTLTADRRLSQAMVSRRDHRPRSSPERHRAGIIAGIRRLPAAVGLLRTALAPRSGSAGLRRGKAARRPARVKTTGGRRPVLILAGAAAATVLVGGLLWPTGDAAESADAGPSATSSVTPSPAAPSTAPGVASPEGDASTLPGVSETDGPAGAVDGLLTSIAECQAAEDTVCAHAVAAGSVGVVDVLGAAAEGSPTVELVDEYGDVAVIRLRSASPVEGGTVGQEGAGETAAPDRMLVLVRQNDKWLVRDVYGVADQPE